MFSFGKRKKQVDVHRLLRRIVDSSSPNMPRNQDESRWEDRPTRILAVVLAPYADNRPSLDESTTALTKNISSQGVCLLLPQPFRAEQVVVGFWQEDQAEYVLGEVRQNAPFGGGFWQLGIELIERISPAECPALRDLAPLAADLVPSAVPAALLPSFGRT